MKKYLFLAVSACLTLSACEDVPAPYELFIQTDKPESDVVSPAGSGTVDDPYNIAMVNEILDGGKESTSAVYIKGIICKVPSIDTSYGNATYYISDNGSSNDSFEIYRGYSLGGAKFTSEDEIQMGDTVVVLGVLTNYNNGTYEMSTGSSIYSINGKTSGNSGSGSSINPAGSGTASDPYNVAMANHILDGGNQTTSAVYVKGIICKVPSIDLSYGNAVYYISDDGSANDSFEIYRGYSLGGAKFKSEDEIQMGDTVVVLGVLTNYNGTYEMTTGSSIYSINGKTSSSGGDVNPDEPVTEITLAEFLAKADTTTTYQLTGMVGTVKNETYGNFYFVSGSDSIYVYGLVKADGTTKIWSSLGIKTGDEITIQGIYTTFNNAPEIKNAIYVSHKSNGSGSGDDPNPGDGGGETFTSIQNGDFEAWTDGKPDHWKTASTAGSATLSQSTDAHGGTYSVNVNGATANKRLGYEETTFPAGTYEVTFYAKALGGDACTSSYGPQVRPGYVPVTNGSVGTYVYADGYTTLTVGSWVKVTHTFTLDSETVICPVVMNAKNSGDILIDDYSITKQ